MTNLNSQKNMLINPLSEIKRPLPDFGEDDAFLTLMFGVLSIIFNPICSILSFIFANQYKKRGNGENRKKVIAGKILSISSFVLMFTFYIAKIYSYAYIFAAILAS